MRLWFTLVVAVHLGAGSSIARAQAGEKAEAQAFFDRAVGLMKDKRYAEACPLLEESQRLDPGLGTMLYLADCYEKTRRSASAWALFREAEAEALERGDDVRRRKAQRRAEALEAKLGRLLVALTDGAAQVEGLEVTRDGKRLSAAAYGTPLPLDRGVYVVGAAAPGRVSWSERVQLEDGVTVSVEVPVLALEPPVEPAPDVAPVAPRPEPARADVVAPPSPDRRGSRRYRTAALASFGVGVVALGVTAYYGWSTIHLVDRAREEGCNEAWECDSHGRDLLDDAGRAQTVAIVAGIAAIAAGVTGSVLYWKGRGKGGTADARLSVAPSPDSLAVVFTRRF